MSRRNQPANPFYLLVVLVGIVFCVTALAYVAALVRAQSPGTGRDAATRPGPIMDSLAQRGDRLLLAEAGGLAVVSVLAMGLDRWRSLRDRNSIVREPESRQEP